MSPRKTWIVGSGIHAAKHTMCVLCNRDTLHDGTGLCPRCYSTGHGFDHLPMVARKAWVKEMARKFGLLPEK